MGPAHLPRSRRPVDYYDVLGVAADATFRDIEQAYWALAKSNRALVPLLNMAYEVLGDPARRATYDEQRVVAPSPQRQRSDTPAATRAANSELREKLRWYLQ
jgi:curved DNA-binding protein CbpA